MLDSQDQSKLEEFMENEDIESISMLIHDYIKMRKVLSNINKDINDIRNEGII